MRHYCRFGCKCSWLVLSALLAAGPARAMVTALNYWRMGENDAGAVSGGTTTNTTDIVGANNLIFNAAATYTSSVAPVAASVSGSTLALQLTGGVYAAAAAIPNLTNNFGIECWVKLSATAPEQVVVYNGNTSTSGCGIFEQSGTFYGLAGGLSFGPSAPATAGAWTEVALVRANGTSTLYVNGVASVSTDNTMPRSAAGNFLLGANNVHSQNFTGSIDEVRVFTFVSGQFQTNDLLYYAAQPLFTLGMNTLNEAAAAGTDSVSLAASPANAPWTATANASWLHLVHASGTGSGTVSFTFDANPGAGRSGTLTIAGETVTVNQGVPAYSLGGNYDFYWTGDLLEEPWNVCTDVVSIVVSPNVGQWTISAGAGWIHPSATSGSGTTNLSVTFDANTDPGGAVRFSTIYVNNPAGTLLRAVVFQEGAPGGTGQVTYRFTGTLQPYLPGDVPPDASVALRTVQANDVFYLTMTLAPSAVNDYYETWPCAANNITFSVPSRGLVYSASFEDLEVLDDGNNPDTVRWDVDGVDSTVNMVFWARDFNMTALDSGGVPNPLNLTGFHANGFAQVILYNGTGGNPELFYGNLVPIPALNEQVQQQTNTLSWVTSDLTYPPTLLTSTSLLSGAVWQTVTNAPAILSLTNFVTLPATNGGAQFFRLRVL